MKVRKIPVEPVEPESEIQITLTKSEAAVLTAVLGHIDGDWNGTVRSVTRPLFYKLTEQPLNLDGHQKYSDASRSIFRNMQTKE